MNDKETNYNLFVGYLVKMREAQEALFRIQEIDDDLSYEVVTDARSAARYLIDAINMMERVVLKLHIIYEGEE